MNNKKNNPLILILVLTFHICNHTFAEFNNDTNKYLLNNKGLDNNRKSPYSINLALKELELAKTKGNKDTQAILDIKLGKLYLLKLEFEKSLYHINSAKHYYKETGDNKNYAAALVSLAGTFEKQGKYNSALVNNLEAFEIYKSISHTHGQMTVCNNIGNLNYKLANIQKALSFYKLALSLSDSTNIKMHKDLLANIGAVYFENWNYDSSIYYFNQVKNIELQTNDSLNLAKTYNSIGNVLLVQNKISDAIIQFELGLILSKQFQDFHTISSLYSNLGIVYSHKKMLKKSIVYFDSSQYIASENNLIDILLNIYYHKSLIYESQHNYKKALVYYRLFEEISNSISIEKNMVAETETLLLKQKQDNKILRLEKEREKKKNLIIILVSTIILIAISGILIIYILQLKQKNKLDKTLAETRQQQFQAVIEAQDNERKRIAGDLHDSVGQLLSLTKLNITDLLDNASQSEEEYKTIVEKTISVIDEACNEVREISHNLMPGSLMRLGFIPALKELVRKINDNNILKIEFTVENLERRQNEKIEIALYRIMQEILNNAIRHSGANNMYINLRTENEMLVMSVKDDGKGFQTEKINESNGIGWKNIFSRLNIINGTIDVKSRIGEGVIINIKVPV